MESVVVTIDRFGRVLLPKEIRQEADATQFIAVARPKEITLTAVPSWKEMLGSMRGLDLKAFKKQHEEDSFD